jgi:UV DNA damage repair endonuclease
MHLIVYHHSILDAQGLDPAITWAVLIGGGYGFVRAIIDATRTLRGALRGR